MPGLAIDVDDATDIISGGWLTTINNALTIEGNGATLVGNPSFVGSNSVEYTKYNVDVFRPSSDFLAQQAFSFGKLEPGVFLTISALNTDGLNGYLQLGEGSTASLSDATARNSVSYGQRVPRSVFEAKENSTLNLSQVALERINPELFGVGPAWVGAISGVNATPQHGAQLDQSGGTCCRISGLEWWCGQCGVVADQRVGRSLGV